MVRFIDVTSFLPPTMVSWSSIALKMGFNHFQHDDAKYSQMFCFCVT